MAAKSKYFQLLLNTRYNYKKEIDIINKNNELEKKKTKDAIKRYQESLTKIEEDFDVKMDELPRKEKKRVEAIVKEFDNDPDKLAKEIADILGANNV